MGSVKALSDTVRNSIRSGIIVYDLSGVVEELVFNSLDANATKVSVYVSVGHCCVKVVDDGFGISRDGLVLLGERYVTSKHHNLDGAAVADWCYGFRGEALASISDVSLLEIVTKTSGKPNGYCKIIKGSKCLYLGIYDDQKDVGTTVIARDVFYNQPVRRKHMQASPKKVLDAVKKCVFQIALVNPKVSFKVVDTESEDVLLHALPSSTLSRLMTGFGIEDSDSFCEVNVSDGALKLSGYVSGPCSDFSIKAFQYVYINSRFVCKGPIHKLINNLSTSIEDMHPFSASSVSGKGKRSRPDTYPAYILNLCCPLSLYDLSFEPSKTNVEFKDWVPILDFIKEAIQQLWRGSGELPSHVDHVFEKDGIWDEYENLALADNGKHEPEPLKGGIKTNQSSCHLASSSLEILKKEINDMFNEECDRVPTKDYYMNDSQDEQQQASEDIVFDDSPFICSRNAFFSQHTAKLPERSENCSFTSDHKFQMPTDYLLEDRFLYGERSGRHAENHILSLNWQDEPSELEYGERNQCNGNPFSLDSLGFGNVLSSHEDIRKPCLRNCISKRSLIVDGAVLDTKDRFAIDNFRSKRRRLYGDENIDSTEVEVSDQRFDVFPSTSPLNEIHDMQLFPPGLTFDLLAGATTKSFSTWKNPLAEEHDFECGSVRQTDSFGLGQFLHSGSSATSNAVFTAKACDAVHFPDDNDASEESSRLEKRENHWDFTVGEEMRGKSSYDVMSKRRRQDNYEISPRSTMFDFNSCSDSFSDFGKIFKGNKELPVQHTSEEDWLSVNLSSEMQKNNEPYKVQGDQLRCKNLDQNHLLRKRSIRSHSAPPFHKCKRKFVSLKCHLMREEGKSEAQFCSGVTSTETVKLKHQNVLHKCRKESDTVNKPDIMLDREIQKAQNFEHSETAVSQATLAKERAAALVDYGSKWRENCQRIAKSHASSASSRIDLLNINSGLLHLAGNSLVPESLHKSCLEDAKVLLQVDKKFIPIVAGGTLAVIDQHAADERIRLEELRQKVLSGEAKTISYLNAEKELILPEAGYQLLHSYAEQTREWGWICNIHTQSSGTFERNLNVLHQQSKTVTLLAVPCILGVNLSDGDLLEFLQQLADTDGSSTMPPSVLRVLNYKACRGAIMFGDSLLHSECSLLVEELKKTSLCFQCAHGRPTTVPLVNLDALHKQIAKLGVVNDDSSNSWHGLCRQEISIDRAAKRLTTATS